MEYENLVYCCRRCNSFKNNKTINLDPTLVALADHLHVHEDGRIEGLTSGGEDLISLLDLNGESALEIRRWTLLLLRAKSERPDDDTINKVFLKWFGYPSNLPDLARLTPPSGNSRQDGLMASHYARHARGELPPVY